MPKGGTGQGQYVGPQGTKMSLLLPSSSLVTSQPLPGVIGHAAKCGGTRQQTGGGVRVQSPGLTHTSQRCLGPLSPSAIPRPLGQVTLKPAPQVLPRGWGPQPWAVNNGVSLGRTLKLPMAKWMHPPASVGPQNWDAATSAQAARTRRRQCPRQGTWCPCPPHLGECSPLEPPQRAPLRQRELQPCRLPP